MPFGPKSLKISFTGKNVTHFGGVYLLHLFFKRIKLKSLFSRHVFFAQRNNHYTISEVIFALIYPITLGFGRIETTHLLRHNGVFQYLTGLPTYPDPQTLRRFLLRMAPLSLPRLRRLHDKLLSTMMLKPSAPTRMIFDMDSTVLVLYGKQEMANIGYNPKKHGRPSYHPLVCFNGITKDFWHGELRPGDAHTATGVLDLMETSFAKVPSSVKVIIIRADKGFFDHKTVEYLESKNALFAIVARLTPPIRRTLAGLSYRRYSSGIETAELMRPIKAGHKEHRFVVVRRPIPDDPSEQLSLFTLGRYSYQVIVTNLTLTPLNTWKFYNGRAGIELIIKELKGDYPLAKIPTKHFAANEAYFHILLFSYNLINWFKRLCLPKDLQKMTLNTLRSRLLLIPGVLVKSENRPTLKLPANFWYRDAFEYAIKKIARLKI
ncbi:MAG: IS1380 family transposase [Candidatus Manganitrophaceae bacterium]